VPFSGAAFGFNFDPVADQSRVVSDTGQNMRIAPNTGAVIDSDPNTPGTQPDANLSSTYVTGLAYANDVPGARSTTLLGIDGANGWLVVQGGSGGNPSPNGGQITRIGSLGVTIDWAPVPAAPFDISPRGTGFAALMVGGSDSLYTIDLATGKATAVGPIGAGADKIVGLAAAPDLLSNGPGGTTAPKGALPVINVTPLVDVRVGRTRFDPATGLFRKKVTVRNIGTAAIRGPLELVLDNLPRKVRLRRPTGFTRVLPPLGSPFRNLVLPGGVLNPGQAVALDLEFLNPLHRRIGFTTRVLQNPA
jgi:hypothetical protein